MKTELALLLALTALLSACTDKDKDTDTDTDLIDTETVDTEVEGPDGDTLFATYCSSCHGADGTGSPIGPNIAIAIGGSDESLTNIILNGNGSMPPVNVTDEEAQAIVTWMKANL